MSRTGRQQSTMVVAPFRFFPINPPDSWCPHGWYTYYYNFGNVDWLRASTQPVRNKSRYEGYADRVAAWRWKPGQSGNAIGKRNDLAAEMARAAFENNADALYKAFTKALLKGNAYAFKELSDRAYGRLKERVEFDVSPYRNLTDDELKRGLGNWRSS